MLTIIRTDPNHPHFLGLVKMLDADLAIRDGEDHVFYAQFNTVGRLKHALVAYEGDLPVACGAIKEFDDQSVEVKRMFTHPEFRKKGIASAVLSELEQWASEMGKRRCVLETGMNQPEAIAMYNRCGYQRMPNFGQYAGVENSVCFEKQVP